MTMENKSAIMGSLPLTPQFLNVTQTDFLQTQYTSSTDGNDLSGVSSLAIIPSEYSMQMSTTTTNTSLRNSDTKDQNNQKQDNDYCNNIFVNTINSNNSDNNSTYSNGNHNNNNNNNNNNNSNTMMNSSNIINNSSRSLVVFNGRKVMGPPENWIGPPPTGHCELYLRRVPKDLNEHKLVEAFLRFGSIYEIRLPLDYQQANRGYAYIKYSNENEAGAALDVMQHYFITPGVKFDITHSYEKCRLYISNIPYNLTEHEIEQKLRNIFPQMQRIYFKNNTTTNNTINFSSASSVESEDYSTMSSIPGNGVRNNGSVIVQFSTHALALDAKKNISPGVIRLWDRDLKVMWANSEREADLSNSNKTLFFRNVDLTVNPRDTIDFLTQHVTRTQILKVTRVRQSAFVDFATRESAECVLKNVQGCNLKNKRLEIEWAKPSDHTSLHRLRHTDFDAVLRLKCIANNWLIPIVIFGTYYEADDIQYGVIILRNVEGSARAVFCIMHPKELVDIHSRMCEVVCVLIETIGTFPDCNYVFSVQRDTAHLLGMVTHGFHGVMFSAAHNIPPEYVIDLNEVSDLSCAVAVLTSTSEEPLLTAYCESFRCQLQSTYLEGYPLGHRKLGTIMPNYRNKPALRYNLNDSKIVLALCYTATGSNAMLPTRPHLNLSAAIFDSGCDNFTYMSVKLLPIALTQSRLGQKHVLSHIQFGGHHHYYHPDQRIMSPPIWISLYSYSTSIKQLTGFSSRENHQALSPSNNPTYYRDDNINNQQQEAKEYKFWWY